MAAEQFPMFPLGSREIDPFYRQHGFCLVTGLWTSEECDEVTELARSFPGRHKNDYRPLMQPQRTVPAFLYALRNPNSTGLVESLLNGMASGLQMEFFFGPPRVRGFAAHQDNFYVEAPSHGFLSIWSAMTAVTEEMGGLYLYPGSHRYGRLPVRKSDGAAGPNQDPNARNEETVLPDMVFSEPASIPVPKGAAVVLHGDVVHGSLDNRSEKFRCALLCTYLRKGTPFRAGRFARREEIDLHPERVIA
jgi:phytanoyl-CoA hydroxylase